MILHVIVVLSFFLIGSTEALLPSTLISSDSLLTLSNGFTTISVNLSTPQLTNFMGDMLGEANFSKDVLSSPIVLQREDTSGTICQQDSPTEYSIVTNTSTRVAILVTVSDCSSNPLVKETWALALNADERGLEFEILGSILRDTDEDVRAVRRVVNIAAPSIYAFFEQGVNQPNTS